MRLIPLLILMTVCGLIVGFIFPHLVTLLVLAPVSVAIGYTAGRSNRHRELR